jgi:hypothetical protein
VKDEEVPNSLLSRPKDILHCCIVFAGKGHYHYVGSVCQQIKKIYANEDNDMKETIWSNVTVSKDLADLCLQDHQKLEHPKYQIQSMVDTISEVAAKSGNVKVWNDFYSDGNTNDYLYKEVAEDGHIKILELADRKKLDWYHREILVDAAARTDLEVLDFFLNKKPTKFNLSFTRMCAREGFVVVMEWRKQMELIELFSEAAYGGQWRILDSLYENEYQQAPPNLKEILKQMIVNWAASAGEIDALEWAQDQGIHDDAESCMWAAFKGHLHVLQWLQEDGATWDSHVISYSEEHGYKYVVEWDRENGCPEP